LLSKRLFLLKAPGIGSLPPVNDVFCRFFAEEVVVGREILEAQSNVQFLHQMTTMANHFVHVPPAPVLFPPAYFSPFLGNCLDEILNYGQISLDTGPDCDFFCLLLFPPVTDRYFFGTG